MLVVNDRPFAAKANMPTKRGGRGKAKADAAVEEEPAAKKAATMPPNGGADGPMPSSLSIGNLKARRTGAGKCEHNMRKDRCKVTHC